LEKARARKREKKSQRSPKGDALHQEEPAEVVRDNKLVKEFVEEEKVPVQATDLGRRKRKRGRAEDEVVSSRHDRSSIGQSTALAVLAGMGTLAVLGGCVYIAQKGAATWPAQGSGTSRTPQEYREPAEGLTANTMARDPKMHLLPWEH